MDVTSESQDRQTGTIGCIPHSYGPVVAAGGHEGSPVGAGEGAHCLHWAGVAGQWLPDRSAGGRVPSSYGPVVAAGGQQGSPVGWRHR